MNQRKNAIEEQHQIKEHIQKAQVLIGNAQLIYKRIILGIIISILLVITLFYTVIIKQTIIAKDYIDTKATYVDKKNDNESDVFDYYIYTFKDKQGRQQEIVVSVSKNETPKDKIKLKYNEHNPQEYYEEGATIDTLGVVGYVVIMITMIPLIILFFNKKLLSQVHIG